MVRSFIEAILGEVGRQILYYYEANAYWINVIVLIYGVFMFAAWMNMVRIYRFLIVEMAKEAHTSEELNRKKSNKKIRDIIGIPGSKRITEVVTIKSAPCFSNSGISCPLHCLVMTSIPASLQASSIAIAATVEVAIPVPQDTITVFAILLSFSNDAYDRMEKISSAVSAETSFFTIS